MSHPAAPRRNQTLPSVSSVIANRWSPRGFDADHELDEDAISTLLDAARWAPSASNTQPCSYVVAHRGTGRVGPRAQLAELTERARGLGVCHARHPTSPVASTGQAVAPPSTTKSAPVV